MVRKLEARPWATSRQPFQVVPDGVRGRVEVICGESARASVLLVLAAVAAELGPAAGPPAETDSGVYLPLRAEAKLVRERLTSRTSVLVKLRLGESLANAGKGALSSGRR